MYQLEFSTFFKVTFYEADNISLVFPSLLKLKIIMSLFSFDYTLTIGQISLPVKQYIWLSLCNEIVGISFMHLIYTKLLNNITACT